MPWCEFVKSAPFCGPKIYAAPFFPHSAKPRIVRDGLIQALTRTDIPSLYSEDPKATKINVIDMGVRGFTRKIATMEKADSKLMCAQCHVEYNCNPGFDPKTGKAIGMNDVRTNLFPFVDVTKIDDFYAKVGFKDFKHNVTGAALTKMQHPDVETYWNSTHGFTPDEVRRDLEGMQTMRTLGNNMAHLLHSLKKADLPLPEQEPRVSTNFIS